MKNQKGVVWVPILLMVVAVAAFSAMAYAVYRKNVPAKTSTDTTTNTSTGTVNASITTNSSTTNTAAVSAKASTDTVDPANPNVHTYTSYKLGVQFQYWSSSGQKAGVLEQGDRIYVYAIPAVGEAQPTKGQSLEVFAKTAAMSLQQAVTDRFLKNYDAKDCFVTAGTDSTGSKSKTGIAAVINFPSNTDANKPWWANGEKCPAGYSLSNGLGYFWTDADTAEKYLFFSIGQYAIGGNNQQTSWHESVKFVNEAQASADANTGWKTYTNTEHGYSVQYRKEWTVQERTATYGTIEGDSTAFLLPVVPANPSESNVQSKFSVQVFNRQGSETVDQAFARVRTFSEATVAGIQKAAVKLGGLDATKYTGVPALATEDDIVVVKDSQIFVLVVNNLSGDNYSSVTESFTFDETLGWKTYKNTTLGYSLKYPSAYTVRESGDNVYFSQGTTSKAAVRYRLDSVDGSLATWFDTAPVSGDVKLGDRTGKEFEYQYGDAGSYGSKTDAYVVQHKSKLLGLEFVGDYVLDTTEQAILSNFRFTE